MEQVTDGKVIEKIQDVIEYFALGIEVLAVAIIVIGLATATYVFLTRYREPGATQTEYGRYRVRLGRTLLLGLEVLVAADVVRTMAVDSTLDSVAVLAVLVVIRTFLSWSIDVEIEGRWPWQRKVNSEAESPDPSAN